MTAEIISIGDELLIGQIVDSNAVWIAERLHHAGVDIVAMETVPDNEPIIAEGLRRAIRNVDLVVMTGGLGPTHDDVTRQAVASAMNVGLSINNDAFRQIERRYEERGRDVPNSAEVQATIPDGFEVIINPVGTAPGFWRMWKNDGRNKILAVLPGVPAEMQVMMKDEVLPRIHEHRDLFHVKSRVLLTTGLGESTLQDQIKDIVPRRDSGMRLAYLASPGVVRLRITGSGEDSDQVEADLDGLESRLRERLGRVIFGVEEERLEEVVGRLLRERELTISVAESCTGGLVASRISDVSGASNYLMGAVVAYGNAIKMNMLGVSRDVLDADGAVSREVAIQMARGIRERVGSDIGISTTGIAGPTGGTPDKPVGTVWIGYAGPDGEEAQLLQLVKHRGLNKELTTVRILDLVRHRLLSLET